MMPISPGCARAFWRESSAISAKRHGHRAALSALALALALAACGAPQRTSRQPPAGPPVAVRAALELEPLDVSPDGDARLLVRLRYRDAHGAPAHVPRGGHVDVAATRGSVQWQPRARYGDPAAIVRLTQAGPLGLTVTSDLARLPRRLRAFTDTRGWGLATVTARALGPHTAVIGWFPRVLTGTIRITRAGPDGRALPVATLAAPASTFSDAAVRPGAHYTYQIVRPGADPIDIGVDMPAELPGSGPALLRGKAMWLSFDDVARWDTDAMLERARSAGVRAIELRLTYGEMGLVTPARSAAIDRLIDGAAEYGIAIVGWVVPRAATFEDLAASLAAAAYCTPARHCVRGLAVDLERGADFLGSRAALSDYIARLRAAVGPHVLLVATVEDPYLEQLPADAVPYAAIAASADVLQPMTYWRMRAAGTSLGGMRAELAASYHLLRRLAARDIAIDIGGQTATLGNRYGAPPPDEVAASVGTARRLGAIGETFFDWDGTSGAQWAALAAAPWPVAGRE